MTWIPNTLHHLLRAPWDHSLNNGAWIDEDCTLIFCVQNNIIKYNKQSEIAWINIKGEYSNIKWLITIVVIEV